MLSVLLAAFLIVAASSVSLAGERAGGGGTLLSWRPFRPPHQSVRHADEQVSRTQPAAIAGDPRTARTTRATRVDPQVKRVVLQLSDDPLANPFNDPMPRSPFRSSGLQTIPAETDEQPAEPGLSTDNAATSAQPPNPFEAQPSEPDEPAPLPADDATAPPRDDIIQSPFGPLGSDLGVAPDPKADCETALRNLKANRLNRTTSRAILDLAPREGGALPYECTFGNERLALNSGRDWGQTCYTWKASGLCHKPLYFEQAHMERYGHSWGPVLDPVISGAHFFATVPMLPYKMGLEPPCECIYPLGHYRPGNCAPHYIEPFPWSIRAAALEASAVTGLIFAVP
ncbi:MAG: hypothetical protein WD894_25815 [Pirellulales bacterium]